MSFLKVQFNSLSGTVLTGVLEMPDSLAQAEPRAFAVFAHCFTCGKGSLAAVRISRALARVGIAVLRFDFTGLGESDGDFGAGGFGSNVDDLVAAADWLSSHYSPPALLIGHSLGGTAALHAAARIDSIAAVATIGAPAQARHALAQIRPVDNNDTSDGERVEVTLGGRPFSLQRRFIEELASADDARVAARIGAALLVMHAPGDTVVDINEAQRIFIAAAHPRSFVSLDSADHFLRATEDAQYAADVVAAWASRYLPEPVEEVAGVQQQVVEGEVRVSEGNHEYMRLMQAGKHRVLADEPLQVAGGGDAGPSPYDFLLMSLGACTSMTIRQYAKRKGYPLSDVKIALHHQRVHASDCSECEGREGLLDRIDRTLEFDGDLTQEQSADLVRIANRCPVHKTLENRPVITTSLRSATDQETR